MEHTKESWKYFLSHVVHDTFFTSFFLYGVSFFLESFYKGIVVNYVNLKIILIICIVSGIFSVLTPSQKIEKHRGILNGVFIFIFSIAGAIYTYHMYPEAWRWRMVFSFCVGTAFLSILIIFSRMTSKDSILHNKS